MVPQTQRLERRPERSPMTDTIILSIPSSPRMRSVATLVLGGVGSRVELPYERIDDLQLAVLSVLPAAADAQVTLEVAASDDALSLEIGPLVTGSHSDPGLRRVMAASGSRYACKKPPSKGRQRAKSGLRIVLPGTLEVWIPQRGKVIRRSGGDRLSSS